MSWQTVIICWSKYLKLWSFFFFFSFSFTDFSDQSWIAAPHCDEIEPEDSQHLATTLEFTERHKNKGMHAQIQTHTHTHSVLTIRKNVSKNWKESPCRPSTFTTLPFSCYIRSYRVTHGYICHPTPGSTLPSIWPSLHSCSLFEKRDWETEL